MNIETFTIFRDSKIQRRRQRRQPVKKKNVHHTFLFIS